MESYWNSVATSNTASVAQLISTTGVSTGYGLQMVTRFSAANLNGTTDFSGLPSNATRDSFFGNLGTYTGLTNIMPEFYLHGLNPSKQYNITIYASRIGSGDN